MPSTNKNIRPKIQITEPKKEPFRVDICGDFVAAGPESYTLYFPFFCSTEFPNGRDVVSLESYSGTNVIKYAGDIPRHPSVKKPTLKIQNFVTSNGSDCQFEFDGTVILCHYKVETSKKNPVSLHSMLAKIVSFIQKKETPPTELDLKLISENEKLRLYNKPEPKEVIIIYDDDDDAASLTGLSTDTCET